MLYRVVVNDPDLSNPLIEPRLRPLLAAAFRKDPRSRPAAPDLLDYLLPRPRGPHPGGSGVSATRRSGSTPAPPASVLPAPPAGRSTSRHPAAAAVSAAAASRQGRSRRRSSARSYPQTPPPQGPPPGYPQPASPVPPPGTGAGYHQPGQPYPWAPASLRQPPKPGRFGRRRKGQ